MDTFRFKLIFEVINFLNHLELSDILLSLVVARDEVPRPRSFPELQSCRLDQVLVLVSLNFPHSCRLGLDPTIYIREGVK